MAEIFNFLTFEKNCYKSLSKKDFIEDTMSAGSIYSDVF